MRAWGPVAAFAVALLGIWEARELVRVRVVHVAAEALVRMAEAGTLAEVRVVGGVLLAEARVPAAQTRAGGLVRSALGLPPDARLLVTVARDSEEMADLTAALAVHVPVRR